MRREVIEEDRQEIFDYWQKKKEEFETEKLKLIETYNVENLEEDEMDFAFNISDNDEKFAFDFGSGEPDIENADNDEASEFATAYVELLDYIYTDACSFVRSLGYDEWDSDYSWTSWRKDEWEITVPNYPDGIDEIDIEDSIGDIDIEEVEE